MGVGTISGEKKAWFEKRMTFQENHVEKVTLHLGYTWEWEESLCWQGAHWDI